MKRVYCLVLLALSFVLACPLAPNCVRRDCCVLRDSGSGARFVALRSLQATVHTGASRARGVGLQSRCSFLEKWQMAHSQFTTLSSYHSRIFQQMAHSKFMTLTSCHLPLFRNVIHTWNVRFLLLYPAAAVHYS